jgi:hypothetical protein
VIRNQALYNRLLFRSSAFRKITQSGDL